MNEKRWFAVAERAVWHEDRYVTHSSPSLSDVERKSIPVAHWEVLESSRFRARRLYRAIYEDREVFEALVKLGRVRLKSG
jgi:hypothetical protein